MECFRSQIALAPGSVMHPQSAHFSNLHNRPSIVVIQLQLETQTTITATMEGTNENNIRRLAALQNDSSAYYVLLFCSLLKAEQTRHSFLQSVAHCPNSRRELTERICQTQLFTNQSARGRLFTFAFWCRLFLRFPLS